MDNTISDGLVAIVSTAFQAVVPGIIANTMEEILPGVIRRAKLPVYLTNNDLEELTGWGSRKIAYLRKERKIPFIKHGRKILYPTDEIEAFLREGLVPIRGNGNHED